MRNNTFFLKINPYRSAVELFLLYIVPVSHLWRVPLVANICLCSCTISSAVCFWSTSNYSAAQAASSIGSLCSAFTEQSSSSLNFHFLPDVWASKVQVMSTFLFIYLLTLFVYLYITLFVHLFIYLTR